MSWLRALTLAIVLTPWVAEAQPASTIATQFINRAWGTNDGLPQNTVTSMVQTRDGYLWLGTFGGLVRFDGQAFTIFDPGNAPGLVSPRIVTLHEDQQGVLWIGTEGGLSRYERGRFTAFTTADGLPHNGILSILSDSRGRYWVGTGGGSIRFDGRAFRVPPGGLEKPAVASAEMPNGDIWSATWESIVRYRGGADGGIIVAEGRDSNNTARAMLVDDRGRLWIGTANLLLWNGDRFDAIAVPGNRADSAITALADGHDGSIWIGTARSGLFRWRDGKVETFGIDDGLTDPFVKSLLVDRDRNIWIGTNVGGLIRLKPRRAFSYLRPGAIEQSIAPITDDGDGGLWVGATCGGLWHFRNGTFDQVYGAKEGIENDCVWSLWRDPDKTLWIGTMGGGVYRLKDGRLHNFRTNDTTRDLIHVIKRDQDGVLWVGTDSGLARFDGDHFAFLEKDATLQQVRTLMRDRRGTLWFGSLSGLTEFRDGRAVRTYTTKDGLSHNAVRAIHEDADGVLWIGTYGGGLNRFKGGRFVTIDPQHGLHDTAVSRIIEDEQGNFWMSGNKGVYRVSRSQLNAFCDGKATSVTSVAYGTADGMIVDETNGGQPAGWHTADGKFWFPTIKGLVSIDGGDASTKHPPVFVERTLIDGRALEPGAAGTGLGRADAEFHYTAVDLTAAEKTRFRFRLAGYDHDWLEGGTRRIAYYTNIPPGRYTFEVMATNGEGEWSATAARTALVIAPLWWQRTDVRIASLFALLVVTGLIVRELSGRRARARVAELEREQALDRERSRIARDLHDDLGSILTRIALIAERRETRDSPITSAARQALRTMDELVWAVNARNDTVEAFTLYAEAFAQETADAAGMRVRLNLPEEPSLRVLPADERRHLFLACKEAITNAVKHSGASEIRFSISVADDRLSVEVADNGRGLPPEIDPTGNGLKNYRERMDAVRGDVQIESAPGKGTVIRFRVPIEAEAESR